MAINITNLVNAINAKSATIGTGVDSALDKAVSLAGEVKNASIYSTINDLPAADSSNSGEIVRLGRSTNASTKYYISFRDKWKQIGVSDSDVVTGGQFLPFQGTNFGYTSGSTTTIDKFSFASDGNATNVGVLSLARNRGHAGQSSEVFGYTSGGYNNGHGSNVIDKFPFAADGNATDVGNLTQSRSFPAGQSSNEFGYGYNSGGEYSIGQYAWNRSNRIDKFPFASDANATIVGGLTRSHRSVTGQSSTVSGYTSGGGFPGSFNNIDKFPFATDTNATDVGDLTVGRYGTAGQSSTVSGYNSGGTPTTNRIDKFPFASNANATTVGDLSLGRYEAAGQSSTASGYTSGGRSPTTVNNIDKFPFASDGNATDVGDLTVARFGTAGQQY